MPSKLIFAVRIGSFKYSLGAAGQARCHNLSNLILCSSRMSPYINLKFGFFCPFSKFFLFPDYKLSKQTTPSPKKISLSIKCEPIKPNPPVTKFLFINDKLLFKT